MYIDGKTWNERVHVTVYITGVFVTSHGTVKSSQCTQTVRLGMSHAFVKIIEGIDLDRVTCVSNFIKVCTV